MAGTSTDVDGYLAGVAGGARAALEQLRRTIRAVAPEAAESISYGMPTVKYRGCPLVYFAAWKKHCALYALDFSAHSNELAAFDISGGTSASRRRDRPQRPSFRSCSGRGSRRLMRRAAGVAPE